MTGDAGIAYLSAWMEQERSGVPVNARALARDAVRARFDRRALGRLRVASLRVKVRSHASVSPGRCLRTARPAGRRRSGYGRPRGRARPRERLGGGSGAR